MVYLGQNCFNSLFDRITIVKVHSEPAIFAWNPYDRFRKKNLILDVSLETECASVLWLNYWKPLIHLI